MTVSLSLSLVSLCTPLHSITFLSCMLGLHQCRYRRMFTPIVCVRVQEHRVAAVQAATDEAGGAGNASDAVPARVLRSSTAVVRRGVTGFDEWVNDAFDGVAIDAELGSEREEGEDAACESA